MTTNHFTRAVPAVLAIAAAAFALQAGAQGSNPGMGASTSSSPNKAGEAYPATNNSGATGVNPGGTARSGGTMNNSTSANTSTSTGATSGTGAKAGNTVERAVDATERGVKRGANATKRAAEKTTSAVGNAGRKTGNAVRNTGERLEDKLPAGSGGTADINAQGASKEKAPVTQK